MTEWKLGGFGRIADYDEMRQAGFDYAELDVPELESLPEEEFRVFCGKVHESGFPVWIGARALPVMEPWFFTDSFCAADYREYLEKACRRANLIGMKKMILGNGKARFLPEESNIRKEKRFLDFLRMFAEIAGGCDLEVVLEPLGPRYTNYINTLPEAVRIIRQADMPNLFTMADLRHMVGAEESFADIAACADYVRHIHMDYPKTYPERFFPRAEDDYDYTVFLDAVRKAGYQGGLTIEADVPGDWKEAYRDAAGVITVHGQRT